MVNPIIKFGIPILGIIVIGLALREAYATSLGSAGGSVGAFGGGIGSAFSGVARGIGDVPRQILGGFGEGLGSFSKGIKSFTSIFGIGNEPIPPSVESGATNPTITARFSSNPVQEVTGSTTGSSNFSALSYRQAQGF